MSAIATSRTQKKKSGARSKAATSSARARGGKSKVILTFAQLQKQFPELLKFTQTLTKGHGQITMRWGTDIWTFKMVKEGQKNHPPSGYDVEPSQLDRFSHVVRKKIETARKSGKLKTFKGDIEALLDG